MLRTKLLIMFMLLFSPWAAAQTLSPADHTSMYAVIDQQLRAFAADDGKEAYSHAAPIIQGMFANPENFMAMVKKGYAPVYRNKSYQFGSATTDNAGRPAIRILITGTDGKRYEALYTMQKLPDGSWKITGCTLLEIPSVDA
jgi:Domain of unknown function (DUF4864)